tara:strand:+ start:360 stop:497 length:138 start_codon:yes stop_codon:yes gene_type:complete
MSARARVAAAGRRVAPMETARARVRVRVRARAGAKIGGVQAANII